MKLDQIAAVGGDHSRLSGNLRVVGKTDMGIGEQAADVEITGKDLPEGRDVGLDSIGLGKAADGEQQDTYGEDSCAGAKSVKFHEGAFISREKSI